MISVVQLKFFLIRKPKPEVTIVDLMIQRRDALDYPIFNMPCEHNFLQ